MIIDTGRFGPIEIDEKKIITFREGVPGFEPLHYFAVINMEESRPIYWLQATDDPLVALPVVDPFLVVENYSIDISDEDIADLKIEREEDLLLLVVTVIPDEVEKMTANLAAPILINIREGFGKQIVIDSKEYPIRYPIFEAMYKVLKGAEENAGVDQEG